MRGTSGAESLVRIVDCMARSLTLLLPLVLICAGCMTTVRSVGSARPPRTGVYLVYAPGGQLLQKTIWRDAKLVSAWEYYRGDMSPSPVMDAQGWDKPSLLPPRWTQTVVNGTGRMCVFSEIGVLIGWEEYLNGHYVRGAG